MRLILGLVEAREIDREHSQAELSFWLARHAWRVTQASPRLTTGP